MTAQISNNMVDGACGFCETRYSFSKEYVTVKGMGQLTDRMELPWISTATLPWSSKSSDCASQVIFSRQFGSYLGSGQEDKVPQWHLSIRVSCSCVVLGRVQLLPLLAFFFAHGRAARPGLRGKVVFWHILLEDSDLCPSSKRFFDFFG